MYRIVEFENGKFAAEKIKKFTLFGYVLYTEVTGKYLDVVSISYKDIHHWEQHEGFFKDCLSDDIETVKNAINKTNLRIKRIIEI
jgi:hypothetical protein